MPLKNKLQLIIDNFIKKKLKEKRLKLKINDKLDLFFHEVFDSLDFAELNNSLENLGFKLNISKNNYRIPRTKIELLKVFNANDKLKKLPKLNKKNSFFMELKKKLKNKKIKNLVVHSNFTNLLNLNINPEEFLNFLFENLPDITIFVPGGHYHDIKKPLKEKKTPNNEFGILSKKLLTFGKTFRNDNPFDNLIGFNKKQKYFKSNNIIAYGKDSPYRKLLKSNTYIMLLDVDFYYNSMFHMAELDANVPYRKFMKFKKNSKVFTLFARNKVDQYLDYSKFGKLKKIKSISSFHIIDNVKITLIKYKNLYNYALQTLKKYPYFLKKK